MAGPGLEVGLLIGQDKSALNHRHLRRDRVGICPKFDKRLRPTPIVM